MRLVMAGLDYTTADMEVRDGFSPDAAVQRALVRAMPGGDVSGCALVVTCNRTELYISHRGDVPPDGAALLCDALGKDAGRHRRHFVERHERQASEHLMRVAAGLLSSVPGDGQIITQVRTAIETARQADAADPLLEALFRAAVSAGKKIRTRVGFSRRNPSVARQAVEAAERELGGLAGKQALVIGNGTLGRLAAAELAGKGCRVIMTLRDPRRRESLPTGCAVIDFADRHRALSECDIVFSATASPRFTVALPDIDRDKPLPPLFLDLAVPRDIEPAVDLIPGVKLLNVDDLRQDGEDGEAARRRLAEADAIIGEEAEKFDLWRRNRRRRVRTGSGSPDFPVFINLHGVSVLIAGGGKVAARRAEKLLAFGALVHVVSPEIAPALAALIDRNGLRWTREPYHPRHLDGVTLAIAATDRREVNAAVGRDARERGILVSVADERRECTFYFPAIVKSDLLTAGLISNNGDHRMVRRAAAEIGEEMEAIDADYQGGESRKPPGNRPGRRRHGCDTARSS